ncbi:MAG TPA: SDR family NAD(P)-dependent oxidoreductase, partial [Deinococcales bacterium]|nr:SDR family NAD(P)-dependent oxidoreductase [Deinococcales bacterium]
ALALGGLVLYRAGRAVWRVYRPQEPGRGARRTLDGKVIVVTGASSGNGRAIALECARRGAQVVLAARDRHDLDRVAAECQELSPLPSSGKALVAVADVTDREQLEHLADLAVAACGRIDAWINNAGGAFMGPTAESPEDSMRWLVDLNVWGVIHGSRVALSVFRRQGSGHLVNMASVAGRVAFPYMGFYSATKAFVEVFTQALRQELMHVEKTGIRVTAICPVAVRTPFFDRAPNYNEGGRPGAYLVSPVLEPDAVGRAVADGLERWRPLVFPLAATRSLWVMYDLLPGLSDRLMAQFRPDRPKAGPFTAAKKGSWSDEVPISPVVDDEALKPVIPSPHGTN